MTHDDVIIFEKLKLKKNSKTNNCKKNFAIPLNPAKDINITRFTCLRFARQVSPPYVWGSKETTTIGKTHPTLKNRSGRMSLPVIMPSVLSSSSSKKILNPAHFSLRAFKIFSRDGLTSSKS